MDEWQAFVDEEFNECRYFCTPVRSYSFRWMAFSAVVVDKEGNIPKSPPVPPLSAAISLRYRRILISLLLSADSRRLAWLMEFQTWTYSKRRICSTGKTLPWSPPQSLPWEER